MGLGACSTSNYYQRTTNGVNAANPISVSIWVKLTADIAHAAFACCWWCGSTSLGASGNFYVETNGINQAGANDNKCRVAYRNDFHYEYDDSWGPSMDSTNNGLNKWFWIAATINGTSMKQYWSEGLGTVNAHSRTNGYSQASGSGGDYLGREGPFTGWNEPWPSGGIAALKVWQAELTQAELEAERPWFLAQRRTNLHDEVPCEDAGATTVLDYANGYNYSEQGSCTYVAGPPILWAPAFYRGGSPVPRAARFPALNALLVR